MMKKRWPVVGLATVTVVVAFGVGCEATSQSNSEGSPGYCYLVLHEDGSQTGECFETKAELYSVEGLPPPTGDPMSDAFMLQHATAPGGP